MTTVNENRRYVEGADRNNPNEARSHLYQQVGEGVDYSLVPMCEYGWNRADGMGFSILRGHGSARGQCRMCAKRRAAGLPPVSEPRGHKTRWI